MSPIMNKIAFVIALLGTCMVLPGCSNPNSDAGISPLTGKHPKSWIAAHPPAFLYDPGLCAQCHGSDLHGGISLVSCFSASFNGVACHPNGPGHADPVAFATPAQHGAHAKAAPYPRTMSGFKICQLCHGRDYAGGTTLPLTSCMNNASCHGATVNAPHAVPWTSASPSTYQHSTTDPGNGAVCGDCHLHGLNSPIPPPSPAGTGTPGCFNFTLCHGPFHPLVFADPNLHGVSAKAAPDPSTVSGFSTCQTCHGNDYAGGTTHPLTSCLNTAGCHGAGVNAPHPVPWVGENGTYRHTNTNQANAAACASCHQSQAGTPGCFNNTLCHGAQN